ncbi:MAG: hypothetical protein ACI9OJ_000424 [Myxococcota bacterium]|jgi:hypothetical protein
MNRILLVLMLASCASDGVSPEPVVDSVSEDKGTSDTAVDSDTAVPVRALPRRDFDVAAAARGHAWFEGEWSAGGLIPPLALRHLYIARPGQISVNSSTSSRRMTIGPRSWSATAFIQHPSKTKAYRLA